MRAVLRATVQDEERIVGVVEERDGDAVIPPELEWLRSDVGEPDPGRAIEYFRRMADKYRNAYFWVTVEPGEEEEALALPRR